MTFTLQATHFSITGEKVDVGGRPWPLFRATIFNDDDSVLDSREGYDDLSLCQWVESFDFNVLPQTWRSDEALDVDHAAGRHTSQHPHCYYCHVAATAQGIHFDPEGDYR